jgi:hypothetical protein
MKKNAKAATVKAPRKRSGLVDAGAYPKGWDRKRVQALADYYDNQSDEEAIAEAEAAYRSTTVTMMAIPVELVPKVQKLLAKRAG